MDFRRGRPISTSKSSLVRVKSNVAIIAIFSPQFQDPARLSPRVFVRLLRSRKKKKQTVVLPNTTATYNSGLYFHRLAKRRESSRKRSAQICINRFETRLLIRFTRRRGMTGGVRRFDRRSNFNVRPAPLFHSEAAERASGVRARILRSRPWISAHGSRTRRIYAGRLISFASSRRTNLFTMCTRPDLMAGRTRSGDT